MAIKKFFKWWGSELAAMVPGGDAGTRRTGQMLMLQVLPDELVVEHSDRGNVRELGRIMRGRGQSEAGANTGASRNALAATIQGLLGRMDLCSVVVAPELALCREVVLPAAAEENLRQVLGFDMERQTPFRADDVYYDFVVQERDRKNRQLKVMLTVARKTIVDDALALLEGWAAEQLPLADAPGMAPAQSGPAGVPLELLFQPAGRRAPRRSSAVPVLLAVNIALIAAVLAFPLVQQRQELSSVQTQLQSARARAGEAANLRDQLDRARVARRDLVAQRLHRPSLVLVLDELSQRLPDDTYLSRVEIRGEKVSLQGSSKAASALIAILEDSPYLARVEFSSPTVPQGNAGLERFHLGATLVREDIDAPTAATDAMPAGESS